MFVVVLNVRKVEHMLTLRAQDAGVDCSEYNLMLCPALLVGGGVTYGSRVIG